MIQSEIVNSLGFMKMNERIQTLLKHWLMDSAKQQCESLLSEQDQMTYFRLKENLARMYRESGSLQEADETFRELQGEMEDALGKDHSKVLSCLNQYAVMLQKMG